MELRGDAARFQAFRGRWLANDPASFASIYRMLADMDLSREIGSIRCPVLVIAGEHDGSRPPAMVEPIAQAIPRARYKVLPTGHYAGLQTPELIAREIEVFLDSIDL